MREAAARWQPPLTTPNHRHKIDEDAGHGRELIQQEETDYGVGNAYETTMAKANHQVKRALERDWKPTSRYTFGEPVRDQSREDRTFHLIQHFHESRSMLCQLRNEPDPFTVGTSNVTSHLSMGRKADGRGNFVWS